MKLRLKQATFIFLCAFVALSLIQAAGATDIRDAPLNPDLNKSFSEEHTMPTETSWTYTISQSSDGDEWNNLTNTLRVPSDNYSSVQSAVDAAAAGDTVIVESGTYNENVVINSTISLRGIDTGDGFPVIDACGSGTTLSVTADNVTVEGFALTGSGDRGFGTYAGGLYVEANNATLVNLTAWGNTNNGISIYDSVNSTLTRCISRDNAEVGILIRSSPGSILTDCIADDNQIGILIEQCNSVYEASTDTMILSYDSDDIQHRTGTDVTGMDDGLLFSTSSRISSENCWEDMQEMSIQGEREHDAHAMSGHAGFNLSEFQADINYGGLNPGYDISSVQCNSFTVAKTSDDGIKLSSLNKCILTNNSMEGNLYNFIVSGWYENEFIHSIDTSNTVDGKTVYYLINTTGNPEGDFADAGVIYAINCVGLDIHDLTLSNNGYGIYFRNTTSSTITDVTTSENGYGIFQDRSSNNSIDNCEITENQCGIIQDWSSNNSITSCETTKNVYGILLLSSLNNSIANCEATENECGILLLSSLDNSIANCEATENERGILLLSSLNNSIANCKVTENDYGIYFDTGSGYNSIENCKATENDYGIYLDTKSGYNSIENCEATENERGIYLHGSFNNSIENCEATENERGIYLHGSFNNSIENCEATENDYGIYLEKWSVYNSIDNCKATENEYGINLFESVYNTIENCEATRNTNDGICLTRCFANEVNNCTTKENERGMYMSNSLFCTMTQNTMDENQYNFNVNGGEYIEFVHSIDTSNAVDGKPIYYLLNATANPEGDFANAGTIYAVNCTGLDIHDLTLSNNGCGIYFWNTTSSTITDVMAAENDYGILLEESSNNNIVNCRALKNGYLGIFLSNSEHCTLTGNTMDGNQYNFGVYGSGETKFIHSIDTSNTVDEKPIYYLLNATANPEGNFTNAGTIYAVNCTGLDIHNQTISNEYSGIYIRNCTGLDIHNLTLSDNDWGIELRYNTNLTLDTITAMENYYGIYTDCCSDSTIQGVNARNSMDGIHSYNSENIHISDCSVENNNRGITLNSARYCTISKCTISNNSRDGFEIRSSENCILSLNSFVNNSATETDSEGIIWNTPHPLTYQYGEQMWIKTSLMGNHWGKAYTGTDLNGDGIGDTPFTCTGFTDNYPLMEPLSAYTFVEDTDSGDDTGGDHNVGAAGNLNAGDAVTMQFSGTAVTGITITAAEHIDMMVVMIGPVKTGQDGLNGPVYQYLEADLIHTTDDTIAEADFTFSVPTAWLTARGLTPADVVLWRYHDGVWVPLPTEVLRDEGDHIICHAISPGFSYFAVGEGEAGVSPVETTPTAGAEDETGSLPVSTAQPAVPSETEDETAATATPPQQSPAGFVTLLTGLGAATLLFRQH